MGDDAFIENWTTQLRKGLLDLCVLNAVRSDRLYGYEIVRRLGEIDGLVIGEGTVYPILNRLKNEGLVSTTLEESPDGPARKYYHLTERGRVRLTEMNARWAAIEDGLAALRSNGHASGGSKE